MAAPIKGLLDAELIRSQAHHLPLRHVGATEASLLTASNPAFGDWVQVFQGERMTAALLDRLTHRCHIFEMNGESYRFRESVKAGKKTKAAAEGKTPDPKAASTPKV